MKGSRMKKWLKNHSLSVIFALITLLMLSARLVTAHYGLEEGETRLHNALIVAGEGWAEMFQFLIAVLFTKWFRERGSAEDKGGGNE